MAHSEGLKQKKPQLHAVQLLATSNSSNYQKYRQKIKTSEGSGAPTLRERAALLRHRCLRQRPLNTASAAAAAAAPGAFHCCLRLSCVGRAGRRQSPLNFASRAAGLSTSWMTSEYHRCCCCCCYQLLRGLSEHR